MGDCGRRLLKDLIQTLWGEKQLSQTRNRSRLRVVLWEEIAREILVSAKSAC